MRAQRCHSALSSAISSTIPTPPRSTSEGGAAFVSQSLRPYLIAALADRDVRRPTVVVAGDDRAARDLAADLRAWLRPRPVRFYPSRGVAYESHLAPPPHLVGLRVAALDALLDASPAPRRRRSSSSPPSRCRRRCPTRSCARTASRCEVGELLDLDETAGRPRRGGLRARRPGRGPRPVRGPRRAARPLPGDRGARRPRRPLRRSRSSRCAGSRPSPSARWARPSAVEIAPAAELAAEHRELAEIAALEDADEPPRRRRAAAGRPLPRAARPRPRRTPTW